MLEYVHVKNIALIREAEMTLSDHLNILSGETGAGKSILLGSVNLALGLRGGADLIRTGEEEAFVELVFRVDSEAVLRRLKALSVEPEDGRLILSRRLSGKRSVLRLNGEIVTAAFMRQVSELLIDIFGQHEHQSLLSEEKHLGVLDGYGKAYLTATLPAYEKCYTAYRRLNDEIRALGGGSDEERRRRLDFLEFQLQEIEEASVRPGEEEALTEELKRLSAAREIEKGLTAVSSGLSEGAADSVSRSIREISALLPVDRSLETLLSELRDIESLLQDASEEASSRLTRLSVDESRMDAVEERLAELARLKRKYGGSEEEILKSFDRLQHEYDELKNFDENKERMLETLEKEKKELIRAAGKLHEARLEAAKAFSSEMTEALKELNFLEVHFDAEVTETNRYRASGADEVRFLISVNPGEPLKPLAKVASGGELSRIMLAIRTLSADTDGIDTLIFDEIDAGISGRTAGAVAEKMHRIARTHQVICISHLPQIVAAADHHFLIEKTAEDGSAVTRISELDEEESVRELARLLSTDDLTDAGILNAQEMKRKIKKQ